VSADAAAIDANTATFDLSGFLGGFDGQEDNMVVSIGFQDGTGAALGSAQIGPVTSSERGSQTGLLPKSTTGAVPAGTRQIVVTMTATGPRAWAGAITFITRPPEPAMTSKPGAGTPPKVTAVVSSNPSPLIIIALPPVAGPRLGEIMATAGGPALLERNLAACTALMPRIGYDAAAAIAHEAHESSRTIREVARERSALSDGDLDTLLDPLNMLEPGR